MSCGRYVAILEAPVPSFRTRLCMHDKIIFHLTFIKNPDAQLMPSDLEDWETKNGKIPDDVILLVFTNWGRHWPDKKKYLGTDTDDFSLLHFPGAKIRRPHSDIYLFALMGGGGDGLRGEEGCFLDGMLTTNFPALLILNGPQYDVERSFHFIMANSKVKLILFTS